MAMPNRGPVRTMSGLTVLASYPKSGNTWMRAFLASLAQGGRTPDINTELEAHVLARRGVLDAWIGVESSDLTAAEIVAIRPYVTRRIAAAGPQVVKVHDANLVPPGGRERPVPADCIDRVIYIVRDPRDVAISCTHHFGISIEEAISAMNDRDYGLGQSLSRLNRNVDQYVSSWSRHVESWLDVKDLRLHHVRYEDMIAAPVATFTNGPISRSRLRRRGDFACDGGCTISESCRAGGLRRLFRAPRPRELAVFSSRRTRRLADGTGAGAGGADRARARPCHAARRIFGIEVSDCRLRSGE